MNETPVRVGFSSKKVRYTKEQLELLAEWKKNNAGSIYATVVCAEADERFYEFSTISLVQFAESCERLLESWGDEAHRFYEFIRPA